MKGKKLLSFLAVLMVWLLVASSALAITVDGNDVYADGEDMTVTGDGAGTNTAKTATDEKTFGNDCNIYGGSKNADVTGDTSVTIGEGAVVGDVYGGGNNGDVDGDTNVVIEEGATTGDVYGGGHNGDVDGDTNVVIEEGATTGDVYGGGHAEGGDANSFSTGSGAQANVTEDTNVDVSGGNTGDVYGGGHAEGGDANGFWSIGGPAEANVEGQANVTISGGSTGDVHGGGNAEGGDVNGFLSIGGPAVANVEDTNVEIKGGTVEGDVYGGGSSANIGWAQVGNDAEVTIAGGTVKGSVYSSGDDILGGFLAVEGESRIIIEGGNIESGDVYANNPNTRIDLKDTSAFYYTYYVRPCCEDFQLLNPILEEYDLLNVGYECGYCIYQFQGVEEPRTIQVVFQYTYNGNIIDTDTKTVRVEFFQTGDRGVTVSSTYAGSDLYKPASGEATVYFNSEQVVVPVELERYPRDNDDDDDDDVPLNPGLVPGAEDIPLGVPSTGGLTDWSILIAALGFAGVMVVREARRKKS